MKKSAIFKTLATIAAMLCLTTFVSCDNDEEIFSQPVEEPEYVKAEVSYTVTLSEDFFLFYDVTAAVCINEKIVREMDINECDWDYNDIWKGYVPENFFCRVVAKVKDPLPEIDPGRRIILMLRQCLICNCLIKQAICHCRYVIIIQMPLTRKCL